MTNKTLWHQEIQQTRLAYGLSQNKLAVAAGISRPYLSEIETGKIQPSLQIKQKIQDTLDRYNPEYPLELLFDYVRIRFPTNDVAAICHELLRINMDYMLHEIMLFTLTQSNIVSAILFYDFSRCCERDSLRTER